MNTLPPRRVKQLLETAQKRRILVLGDVILDRFLWGWVSRISPEAPVPVLEYDHESCMPGGAANVARNLTALASNAELFGVVGRDQAAGQLQKLLKECRVDCQGLMGSGKRPTSLKVRVIAHQQQVVRIDREAKTEVDALLTQRILKAIKERLPHTDAVIACDYGKGMITQTLLDELKSECRRRGVWLSFDPKPIHALKIDGLSLVTPNRKEAFELAGARDLVRGRNPLEDEGLLAVAERLLSGLSPALLLITLGEQGMLLCQRGQKPFHIPTIAKDVYDVSGAGDTVIASFTLAIAAGASPVEAAIFSNHAAGVVVGKVGTATVSPDELLASFPARP